MIRALDPCCLPLDTSTVLLLPHTLLFTPRSSNDVLKISLDPFRYNSKLTESLKPTPFCSQIMVPFLFPRLKFLYSQLSQIATTEPKSPLNKLQLMLLLVCGSCIAIGSRRKEEKMVPMKRKQMRTLKRKKKMATGKEEERKRKEGSGKGRKEMVGGRKIK